MVRLRPQPLGGAGDEDPGGRFGCGLFFVVFGILQSGTYGWFASREDFSIGGTVLIPKGGISPGSSCKVLLRYLCLPSTGSGIQRHPDRADATPATIGILVSSAATERLAKRHSQRSLIRAGFVTTTVGMALLLALVREQSRILSFVLGLLLMGTGVGVMLTSSVNLVQSSFPGADQGDISGLSRSVSNLGSSLGTALAGSVLVAARFRRQAVCSRPHNTRSDRAHWPHRRGTHPSRAGAGSSSENVTKARLPCRTAPAGSSWKASTR